MIGGFLGALGLFYQIASTSNFFGRCCAVLCLVLMFGSVLTMIVTFFWYWGLLIKHSSGGAGKLLITILLLPFGIGVGWRGGFGGDDPAFERPATIAKTAVIILFAGILLFLACAIGLSMQR